MSTHTLRSLTRVSTPRVPTIVPTITTVAPFSTTSATAAAQIRKPVKKNFKKDKTFAKAKKPEPGARKAFRKRIVLSNNNALEVSGPSVITLEQGTLTDPANVGKMVKLPGNIIDRLRAIEAFKPGQAWGLFRSPHVLLRGQARDILDRMKKTGEEKKSVRMLLAGEKISGKSVLILEALSWAMVNNWVSIHLPEAMELVNAHTEYFPLPDDPTKFYQPTYCQSLITRILIANQDLLSTLPLHQACPNTTPNLTHLTPGTSTLADLLASCKETEFAWTTFETFWKELTLVEGRPPVLLTADGAAHFMRVSDYRDPSFNLIHAHDLCLPHLFVDALSGAKPLLNGGAVIAALSASARIKVPSLDLRITQGLAENQGERVPGANPWEKGYDERVKEVLKDVEVAAIEKMSKKETRVLMEYWAASGLVKDKIDSTAASAKWTLGAGVLGEIEKVALKNMRM